ncbi:MAG: hypothetical protein KDB44_07550 [Mycobacterium sp.]|nr:hypothetical protein [Mycobacterium sp.]
MAKESNGSSDGCATVLGGAIIGVVVLIAAIPKEAWIVIGIVVGAAVVLGAVTAAIAAINKVQDAAEEQAREDREAEAAAAKQRREEKARQQKRRRIEALGAKNAARVDSAQAAVNKVAASEAARSGWLGDVDFTADIRGITDSFRKARSLRKVADQLSALDKPSTDDRKILGEAKATATKLEGTAIERVELIEKCATEAGRIDESLRREREDARTAEQRAELHAKLSAMLYGIEAAPPTSSTDSAADAVMARVWAFREIKNQIQRARDDG